MLKFRKSSILIIIWVWVNTYRYIFSGLFTSIYQLFWCSPGVKGFDPSPFIIHIPWAMASIAPPPPQHWSPASPRALRRRRAAPRRGAPRPRRRRRSCRARRRGRSGARRGPGGCPGSPIRNLGIFGEFGYPIVSLKKHIFSGDSLTCSFHGILAHEWENMGFMG